VHRVTRSFAALTGAAVGVVAAASLATGLAGAGTLGAGAGASAQTPAVAPAALTLGTYNVFVNGGADGTITFAPNFTYTSTIDGNDAGSWVQMGKSITFDINSGFDSGKQCVFAGNLTSKTTVDSRANPATYSCPGYPADGTWFLKGSGAGAVQTSRGDSDTSELASSPSSFSTGKYVFFVNETKFGKITYANDDTWSGTDDGDSGSWDASGNAFGMLISGGNADDIGCLFVGTLSSTGLNSSASPAPYTGCQGKDIQVGIWWAKKK
jgi:hypothetical protein